jgi:hypothetical protein
METTGGQIGPTAVRERVNSRCILVQLTGYGTDPKDGVYWWANRSYRRERERVNSRCILVQLIGYGTDPKKGVYWRANRSYRREREG